MLWSLARLRGLDLCATDGVVGRISDALFDDTDWTVHFFAVNIGGWLASGKVVVAATRFGAPDLERGEIPVNQTVEKIRGGADAMGDIFLRSAREVTGYNVEANNGEIGEVEDFLIDATGWTVRYLAVNTGGWLAGRQVLVAPAWVRDIRWEDSLVRIDVDRARIEHSPIFDPDAPVERPYEEQLHNHYHRQPYWMG
ncbi:MAG TPA: PRC-barrel domain-containing protein [Azospirillaceae bacterium]|nr:PRC-barrel domain-containing protein [Azospirillaceae bacterium]